MTILKKMTVVAIAAALGLSGCVTNAQGQQTMSKTAMYGLGSAAACSIVGALTHGSKGARNSALACGAIGAGVGGYMDYQEQKLREQLQGTGVTVERQGNQIKLTMPENVTFATNSAALSAQAMTSLEQAAQTLATYVDTTISIVGHTDSTGNDAINNPLSYNRAQSVATYLNQRGVAANRMSIAGQGSRQPIASNATVEGRAQNRRVELLINPSQAALNLQ
ncbi:OmpA family protein [Wielerella bovis]|uniref:OmpA family protein n=1 Tax=Wielerella bovis TaxID=2917790 RepID=UPI002018E435|nr:OmpA family protein [Wielerella bovis]ULJ61222.1 OmpA family protein [Wielerella bovis]ULJ65508.1 OmpA family protein [Wielerella bovis]ULJ66448.1 OmpA family protein [Wielerella bovis]